DWTVQLAAPRGETLHNGTYSGTQEFPSQPGVPQLYVTGDGQSCNTRTGSFTVDGIDLDAAGVLRGVMIHFTLGCDSNSNALLGELVVAGAAGPTGTV